MNNKAITFIRNFSYTLFSNLLSILLTALIILIVPRLIGVEDYGFWQLYLFYTSYVGFLHFGWNDGIYLRYGGKEYEKLDKRIFFSQFWMLFFLQFIFAVCIFVTSYYFVHDIDRIFILETTSISLVILNIRYMLVYILQGTNRIKEYAFTIIIGKIMNFSLISILLLIGIRDYQLMIISDLLGNLVSLIYAIYCCRDMVFRKFNTFYLSLNETRKNIQVGIKLMFSNTASNLIIGIVRFGIEKTWGVITFGKLSLTMYISSLMMVFINAIGLIMYPVLRRIDNNKLPNIYKIIRTILVLVLFGVLLLYFPIRIIIANWLPQYTDSISFMAILFPMCIFEGKMSLLINTYLKAMRMERQMLIVNIVTVIVSLITTVTLTIIIRNLYLSVLSILMLLALRSTIAEIFLSKILNLYFEKDIAIEIFMTTIFIIICWFIDSWLGMIIYLIIYLVYLVIKRKEINVTLKNLKILLTK